MALNFKEVTVAIMDDVPDKYGEILSTNVAIPMGLADVVLQSVGRTPLPIGHASLYVKDKYLLADLYFHDDFVAVDEVKDLHAVPTGIAYRREGRVVTEWSVTGVELTSFPTDKRIPRISSGKRMNLRPRYRDWELG